MPTDPPVVLKANIVLVGLDLLTSPAEVKAFSDAVATETVMQAAGFAVGLPTNPPEPIRKLELPRHRIHLDLSANRTVIEREYPEQVDLSRLAGVVNLAMVSSENGDRTPTAFGYNVEVVYNQHSGMPSLQYLGVCLFEPRGFGRRDWRLVGGAGRVMFETANGRLTVQLEPRFGDAVTSQVFMSLNLHKAEQRIPNEGEVRSSLEEVWGYAYAFIAELDERVS